MIDPWFEDIMVVVLEVSMQELVPQGNGWVGDSLQLE